MKKIIAALLTAVLMFAAVSCAENAGPAEDTSAKTAQATEKATDAPATAAPTEKATEAPATEAPATDAPTEKVTEAVVTEAPTEPATEAPTEPVTEAPTEPATEAPTEPVTEAPTEKVTEAPVTEPPTEKVTEAPATEPPVTEAPKEIPENAYFYDRIYIVPPDYYTMQEFAGLPSGLRLGYDPGLCFFNFSTNAATPLQGEDAMVAFVQSAQPGCSVLGYRSFKVDGVDVEQIDYVWASQPIVQSMVTVHLEEKNVIILFAALTTIDNALEEYTAIIDTLGIVD